MKKKSSELDTSYILKKRSPAEKVIYAVVFVLFVIYALSLILPFVWIAVSSLQKGTEYNINIAMGKPFALPKKAMWSNYSYALSKMVYKDTSLLGMFLNSTWYIVIGVGFSVFFHSVTGYCFAKYNFKLKKLMFSIIIFCLTIPIVGTTGAHYKLIIWLGIFDTPMYVVLTSLGGFSGSFLIMYAIFKNISSNYAEAVYIDGGGQYTAFFKVMLPQARPAIVTLFITGAIASWNEYMGVLMYLPSYPTVSSGLYMISTSLVRYGGATYYFAGLVLSIIPILIIFIFASDFMMKNLSMGGLKG